MSQPTDLLRDRPIAYPPRSEKLLRLEWIDDGELDVVVVTFNRPEQRNPIDKDTLRALKEIVDGLSGPGGPRAIVLTGDGDAFSAGGDLKGYQTLYRDADAFRRFMNDFDDTCDAIERSPCIVVAMVNGTCVAGGTEIALACDLIVIAAEARIGDGHLRFAQLPGAGGSQRLVRAIGVQRARQLLLTGELVPAAYAVDIGLATLHVPLAALRERTFDLLREMAGRSRLGQARMKELIRIAQNTTLAEGLRQETEVVHEYATTSYDATEGLMAFAERRPPRYEGR
jgi:enoyl-CoA hydratase/carnithine racemase